MFALVLVCALGIACGSNASPAIDATQLLGNGDLCTEGDQCDSSFCADGVCCDSACAGGCDVCTATLGATSDGTCDVVTAGTSVEPSCSPNICDGASGDCTADCGSADFVHRPIDFVFVVDNSGTMAQEIEGLQNNINQNFAAILEDAGIDYRVIMIAEHGPLVSESVCIEAPLSGIAAGGCANPPAAPINNPPRFFHYDFLVGSHDGLCQLMSRWDQADDNNEAPTGWQEWARPEAFKLIIPFTDDGVTCSLNGTIFNDLNSIDGGEAAAAAFDGALLTLSPAQFGTATARKYQMHSLVGLVNRDPLDPSEPWLPTDPLTTDECPTAMDPGTGYQALSVLTKGLRFSLCDPSSYDVMFNTIVANAIARTTCNQRLAVAGGGTPVAEQVMVELFPNDGGPSSFVPRVADAASCTGEGFYVVADTLSLCPTTCAEITSGEGAPALKAHYLCD